MCRDKTLVIVLAMHRSGSSLTTNVLQRMGLSLGPFDLLGANPHNKYGHFEAVPIYELDKVLLQQAFAFTEDLPESPDIFRRFCDSEGCWDASTLPEFLFERGESLVTQLLESAPISGFKDPRVPLLWPFWGAILSRFAGLKVVPVFVLRSPHEVAMSLFSRSQGVFTYCDALSAAAVHYRRMLAIRDSWTGPMATVRFEPRNFREDLKVATQLCGLSWNETSFAEVYDGNCRHHEAATVAHEAQELYEQLAGALEIESLNGKSTVRTERDAALREQILREKIQLARSDASKIQEQLEHTRRELQQCWQNLTGAHQQIEAAQRQAELFRQEGLLLREDASQLRDELARSRVAAEQLQQQLEQMRLRAVSLQHEWAERGTELVRSREHAEHLQQQVEQSRLQSALSQQEMQQLRDELASSQAYVVQLQQQLEQASARLECSCREAESLQASREQLLSEVARSQQSLGELRHELEQLRHSEARLLGRIEGLESELSGMKQTWFWHLRERLTVAWNS